MRLKKLTIGLLLGIMVFGMTAQAEGTDRLLEYKDGKGGVVKYTKDKDGICRLQDGTTWQHPDIWTSTTGFGASSAPKTKSDLGKKNFELLQEKEQGISYWKNELDTDEVVLDYTGNSHFDAIGLEFAVKSAGLEFDEYGVATKKLDPESAFTLQSYLAQKGTWERMLYRLDEDITVTVKINPNAYFLLICNVFMPIVGLICLLLILFLYIHGESSSHRKTETYTDKRKRKRR